MAVIKRAAPRWRGIACALLLIGFGLSGNSGPVLADVLPILPDSWTLAILPDTQGYVQTPGSAPIFDAQTQFLRDNATALNLKYVLHEGDITEHSLGAQSEWDNALEAMNRLNGAVPYAMVTGNHDVGPSETAASRQSYFDSPNYFGPGSYYASQPSIGGFYPSDKTGNSWHTFTVGDQEWLIVSLEWAPSDPDIAWANQVLDEHPTDRTMVLTHAYLYSDNTRYDWAKYGYGQAYNPHGSPLWGDQPPVNTINDGQEIWDKLIRTHDNVDFVFSGHVLSPGTGYRSDLSSNGHVVHQVLANSQDDTSGAGNMRLLEFHLDGSVDVRTYSPYLDKYNTRFDQQFTLQLDQLHGPLAPPPPPLIPNAVAANLIVSGTTNPTANVIGTIQIAQSSTPTFSVPIANRGDMELASGGTRLQMYHGILLASITQFDRPDFVGRHATVEVGRNSFGDGIETLSLTEAGNPSANEVNFNVSVAWFQFQAGFRGAHVNADGTLASAAYNGVVQANLYHPSIGRYDVNLGVNSRTDGMLFTTGDNNSNVVVQTGPRSDGNGWDVRVASNAQDFGTSLAYQGWSFLYLPYSTPGLIGGYYDGEADTTISSVGDFTMQRLGTGQYELTVPGETPQTGMLILTVANEKTVGSITAPDDNFLAYQPSANDTFLINSYDMPVNVLEDTAFNWAFISFTTQITATPGGVTALTLAGDYDGNHVVDQSDYQMWRSQYGLVGASLSADGNHDGEVGSADYVVWRKSLELSGNISTVSVRQNIPEPTYTRLIVMASPFLRSVRVRRNGVVASSNRSWYVKRSPRNRPIVALRDKSQPCLRGEVSTSRTHRHSSGAGRGLLC